MSYNRVIRSKLFMKGVLLLSFVMNTLVLITLLNTSHQIPCKIQFYNTLQRPETCDNCFQHKFEYIINNKNICSLKSYSSFPLKLLVMIVSSPSHSSKRKALRETWLTLTKNNTSPYVRHVFLLGTSSEKSINLDVYNEANLYNDIIQENFLDSFDNLTYKTVMGLKWVSKQCLLARFVLKTDDDMFVNIAAIIRKIIPRYGTYLIISIGGLCLENEKPHRNSTSKYYLSKEDYPQTYFPPFCSGTGYITSFPVIQKLYHVSRNIPFLKLEDVYLGLCLQYLGYSTYNIPYFKNIPYRFNTCKFMFDNVITSHLGEPEKLYKVWNLTCNEKTNVTYADSLKL